MTKISNVCYKFHIQNKYQYYAVLQVSSRSLL